MKRAMQILFITLAMAGVGCGSKTRGAHSNDNNTSPVNPYVPGAVTPGNSTPSGVAVDLVLDSKDTLDTYMGWTSCAPVDTKVYINLHKIADISNGDKSFGGTVSVKFTDQKTGCGGTTRSYVDTFSSMRLSGGLPSQTIGSDTENNKYNVLSNTISGSSGLAYHGFFEDTAEARNVTATYPGQVIFGGAVVLVIDSTNDSNDGSGPTAANGSIWFKNYTSSWPSNSYYPMGPIPLTSCWFRTGPYDCRAWPTGGNGLDTKKAVNPDNGYVRLGTFTNLPIKTALNIEVL